jgi:hypothetical protein
MRYTLLSSGQRIGHVTLDDSESESTASRDRLGRLEPLPTFEPIRAALAAARASMIARLRTTFKLPSREEAQLTARAEAASASGGFEFTTDLQALAARQSPRDRERMRLGLEWSRTQQRLALSLEDDGGRPVTAWVTLIESNDGDDGQLPTPVGRSRPAPVILVSALFGADPPNWLEFPDFE